VLSLLHGVQTGSGAHPTSLTSFVPRIKRPWPESNHPLPHNGEVNIHVAVPPHPHASSWRDALTFYVATLPVASSDGTLRFCHDIWLEGKPSARLAGLVAMFRNPGRPKYEVRVGVPWTGPRAALTPVSTGNLGSRASDVNAVAGAVRLFR
jgi:hypothetical protein